MTAPSPCRVTSQAVTSRYGGLGTSHHSPRILASLFLFPSVFPAWFSAFWYLTTFVSSLLSPLFHALLLLFVLSFAVLHASFPISTFLVTWIRTRLSCWWSPSPDMWVRFYRITDSIFEKRQMLPVPSLEALSFSTKSGLCLNLLKMEISEPLGAALYFTFVLWSHTSWFTENTLPRLRSSLECFLCLCHLNNLISTTCP